MPCYNAGLYISEAIESVINQTYSDWELIIVDDCSSDNSAQIINQYVSDDARIKLFSTSQNSGMVSIPRNIGIEKAQGDYIAFLDADDIWLPQKLDKQVRLAQKNNAVLVYSFYEKINIASVRNCRIVKSPEKINYQKLLISNIIGCSTAMYNAKELGKIYFSDAGHEDYIMWLNILKRGYIAYGVPEVLVLYRAGQSSVSSKKMLTVRWVWRIYREYEKLSIPQSIFYFLTHNLKGMIKYRI